MSLKDEGFRFIVRKRMDGTVDLACWLETFAVRPGDVDATDMEDDEFERLMRAGNAETHESR